jgi:hypothetical protein
VSVSAPAVDDSTVAELAFKYDDFASSHYVKNGEPTDDRPVKGGDPAAREPVVSVARTAS